MGLSPRLKLRFQDKSPITSSAMGVVAAGKLCGKRAAAAVLVVAVPKGSMTTVDGISTCGEPWVVAVDGIAVPLRVCCTVSVVASSEAQV